MILSIESSTANCSVALHDMDGKPIALKEQNQHNIHAAALFIFIDELIKENHYLFSDLKAVAVSKGPGSYTGLRIGVSAAKGLCYSLGIPLISVKTLSGMAWIAKQQIQSEQALLIPMIDARRMEVYNAVYDMDLNEVVATRATIIDEQAFTEFQKRELYFFGDGMPKCREILTMAAKPTVTPPSEGFHIFFLEELMASAKGIGPLAFQKYTAGEFEDLAYFEPYYLKDFVTQSTFHGK